MEEVMMILAEAWLVFIGFLLRSLAPCLGRNNAKPLGWMVLIYKAIIRATELQNKTIVS